MLLAGNIRRIRWPDASPSSEKNRFGMCVAALRHDRHGSATLRRARCNSSGDNHRFERRRRASEEHVAPMDEHTFQTRFNELLEKIRDLPGTDRERLEELAEQTRERRERIQSAVTELQESLDYLRLSVKYLVFDLEATRRENTYLRRLIEQSNQENEPRPQWNDENFYDPDEEGAD